jgi:hypothetical protein
MEEKFSKEVEIMKNKEVKMLERRPNNLNLISLLSIWVANVSADTYEDCHQSNLLP